MKRLLLGGALALASCSSGDGPLDPPDSTAVNSVAVSAPSTTTQVGSTLQVSATPLNKAGVAVAGKTVAWSSTNQTVASVSTTGLVTALAAGNATIRATVDGKTGELDIIVDVNRCTTPLALSVGETRVLSGPEAVSCVTIAGSLGATDYLFVSANANSAQDDLRSYAISAAAGTSSSIVASLAAAAVSPPADAAIDEIVEARVRTAERKMFAGRHPSDLARAGKLSSSINASVTSAVAVAVGDTINVRVPDASAGSNLCTDFKTGRAVIKAVGRKVQLAEDIDAPANGFTQADYTAIAAEFDDVIYPTDTLWFGSPTDVNSDGRITVLYTPEVNKLTPANSAGFTGGFFWGSDLYPRSIPAQNYTCAGSNEAEIFYLLTPDPLGTINNNKRTTADVRQGTRGTIAHEFQHMINQGVRQFNPAVTAFETPWLNEAMSHFAEEAVGRAVRNVGDFQSLDFAAVTASLDDYNGYFRQNLLRFQRWMQRPDTSSPTSNKARTELAPRGAGWALVRYAADHYSSNNARSFFRRLAAGPETGVTNFSLRTGVSFEEIMTGYLIANYTDNLGVAGLSDKYSYKSWNMRNAMSGVAGGNFPLLVSGLPAQLNTQSISGSGNYFRLTRAANSANTTFRMQAVGGGGNVNFATARVFVVRLN